MRLSVLSFQEVRTTCGNFDHKMPVGFQPTSKTRPSGLGKRLVGCLLLFCGLNAYALDLRDQEIKVCDDGMWAPYSYLEPGKGAPNTRLTGYSVEVLGIIFKRHKIRYSIELLPWKRCLREVLEGSQYQMLLNASLTPDRARDYLVSRPYHRTHSHYFYSKKKYPQGLALQGIPDLRGHVLGGMRGYAYGRLEPAMRDTMERTNSYTSLFKMLELGRVDVLLESFEPMLGLERAIGIDVLKDPDLGHAPMPGVPPTDFSMMFTAKQAVGAALHDVVDRELARMEKSGELKRLQDKYLGRP